MKPVVIASEQVIMWDVDQTLVIHGSVPKGAKCVLITCPYSGKQEYLRVHEAHVKIVRDRHARGATNIVWSHGGYRWAQAVVQALGLEPYVAQIMSKPCMWVDDSSAKSVLGTHMYIPINDNYGKNKVAK
jgi:hypothetical protein